MFEIFYKLFDGYWCKGMLEIKKAYGVEKDWKKKAMWCREVQEKSVVEKYWQGILFRSGKKKWSK